MARPVTNQRIFRRRQRTVDLALKTAQPGKLDLSGALLGALGRGGYDVLGVAFFVFMAAVLFRTARKPLQL